MAKNNDNVSFKKMLPKFMNEPDPLFSMLQWMTERLMMLDSENKVGAPKGKHSIMRTTHFSATRVRRFDTGLGKMYQGICSARPRMISRVASIASMVTTVEDLPDRFGL